MATQIEHPRGLVLTLCLFVGLVACEITLDYMTGIGLTLTTVREVAIGTCVELLLFCFLLIALIAVGQVDVRKLLFTRIPDIGEGFKWGFAGIILSISGSVHAAGLPTYFGNDGYVTFLFVDALSLALIMPCLEETLFRAVCFGSLLRAGRLQAYLTSTFLFLLWHVKIADVAFKGTVGLTLSHTANIVVTGLVAAYIYERTGKLLLCVIFHGAGNALIASTPFLMYAIEH